MLLLKSIIKSIIGEIKSPHEKATLSDKRRGYVGVIDNDVVTGYDEMVPDVFHVSHSEFGPTNNKHRFRFMKQSGIVYWNHFPPSDDERVLVEDWLSKKSETVKSHNCAYIHDMSLPPIFKI